MRDREINGLAIFDFTTGCKEAQGRRYEFCPSSRKLSSQGAERQSNRGFAMTTIAPFVAHTTIVRSSLGATHREPNVVCNHVIGANDVQMLSIIPGGAYRP